jgi:hypothetical protein
MFAKPYPEVWLSLTLNTMSGGDGSSLTADIGISSKLLLGATGVDPTKAPPGRLWHHERRMGSVVGAGFDQWWTIESTMTMDEASAVVADFANVLISEALPALEPVLSNQGLLDRWRAEGGRLSPPEVGNMHALELALGLEPTTLPRRKPQDIASELAVAVLGVATAANTARHARGESGEVRVSVSDPNAALVTALAGQDRDALVRILTSRPWNLDRGEVTAVLGEALIDVSSLENKPTSEEILQRLFASRSRRMATGHNRQADQGEGETDTQ